MELSEVRNSCWDDSNVASQKLERKGREREEVNAFPDGHCDKSSDDTTPDSVKSGKCGFKQFVEESTLRSIALDELEVLSNPDGVPGTDGDILGRTSSSVSSEQAPIKYAIPFEWDMEYFKKPEGLVRLALLTCTSMSLACLTTAGTPETDVLELPISSSIRAHIFVTVFSLLTTTVLFFMYITSITQSLPLHWGLTDAAINASLGIFFIFSSSLLLYAEQQNQRQEHPISEWSHVQLSLAAVFGYLSTLFCIFLAVLRSCSRTPLPTSEDIILTSMRNS